MSSRPRTDEEIEEEELQLALALSRSEAETKRKEQQQQQKNYGSYGSGTSTTRTEPLSQPVVINTMDTEDMDPELARYLNRNYWQKRSEDPKTAPSAPQATSIAHSAMNSAAAHQNGEMTDSDKSQFIPALQSSLDIFVNRMRSNSQRGRPIANDSSVQSLFAVISNMLPQLLKYQQDMEDRRAYYEGLQDKLTQLRDAREALDSLRDEHKEKRRREMEEQERLRQIQMMQKLEVMRQKKQEYLEMQRQHALQRLQEQERDMAMRQEQQKQLTYMRQMQAYGYPNTYCQQPMSGSPQTTVGVGPGMMPPSQGVPPSMGPPIHQNMLPHYPSAFPATAGSPIHQHHMHGQPMSQQSHLSGREVPPGLGGNVGPLQGPATQAMGMQPGLNQGTYSQGPAAVSSSNVSSFSPNMANTASSYQTVSSTSSATNLQLESGHGSVIGGAGPHYPMPPSSMGYTDPGHSGYMSMGGYTSMPPTMEYSSFNMQSLANTLPQQQDQTQSGTMYSNLPATQHPSQQPPQQSVSDQQYTGSIVPNQYPIDRSNNQFSLPAQHMQSQVLPVYHQRSAPQSLLDTQLISFD